MNASRVAALSILSNIVVVLMKLIVGVITGSVAVISEAIHSSLDLIAAIIAYFSVRISAKPADKDHPYGHGKFENVSGTVETILIFVAGIWIIYESAHKFIAPTQMDLPLLAVAVMLIGALVNWIVARKVQKVADQIQSVAMKSNALHLMTDVYASLAVGVGLLIFWVVDIAWIDPLIAMFVGVFIIREAYELLREAVLPLLDARISEDEERFIREILQQFRAEYIEYHDFRARKSGAETHIDFHLVLPSATPLGTAHELCDRIEAAMDERIAKAHVIIHLEPEHESKYTIVKEIQ